MFKKHNSINIILLRYLENIHSSIELSNIPDAVTSISTVLSKNVFKAFRVGFTNAITDNEPL